MSNETSFDSIVNGIKDTEKPDFKNIFKDLAPETETAPNGKGVRDVHRIIDEITGSASLFFRKIETKMMIDTCEKNTRAYFTERQMYAQEMARLELQREASPIGFDIEKAKQEINDKYFKKADGTYLDSLEDKYGLGPEFKEKESFSEIEWEFDNAREYVNSVTDKSQLDIEGLKMMENIDRTTFTNLKNMEDQSHVTEVRNKTADPFYSKFFDAIPRLKNKEITATATAPAVTGELADLANTLKNDEATTSPISKLGIEIPKLNTIGPGGFLDIDKLKEVDIKAINECERNMQTYFTDREAYRTEMANASHIPSSADRAAYEQLIKDKYLKKDDGTYLNSIEEKYGLDEGAANKTSFDEVAWEFEEAREYIEHAETIKDLTGLDFIQEINKINYTTSTNLQHMYDKDWVEKLKEKTEEKFPSEIIENIDTITESPDAPKSPDGKTPAFPGIPETPDIGELPENPFPRDPGFTPTFPDGPDKFPDIPEIPGLKPVIGPGTEPIFKIPGSSDDIIYHNEKPLATNAIEDIANKLAKGEITSEPEIKTTDSPEIGAMFQKL